MHYNVGKMRQDSGDMESAIRYYKESIRYNQLNSCRCLPSYYMTPEQRRINVVFIFLMSFKHQCDVVLTSCPALSPFYISRNVTCYAEFVTRKKACSFAFTLLLDCCYEIVSLVLSLRRELKRYHGLQTCDP